MLAVCLRYTGNPADAEDILVGSFMKVFEKIGQFNETGSLEGWIRRIIVNDCLMFLRKRKSLQYTEELEVAEREMGGEMADTSLEAQELMKLVESLPSGYRTVFNLYAIEGYSHKEIAKQLNISEGTSKSQLSKARNLLQQKLKSQESEADLFSSKNLGLTICLTILLAI